jgi:hypothetical protein
MFDRRSASEKFRLAVRNLGSNQNHSNNNHHNDRNIDPISVLASIFRITLATSSSTTTTTTTATLSDNDHNYKANSESFVADNGTDWSSILNPWLDVCETSAKVNRDTIHGLFVVACHGKREHFGSNCITSLSALFVFSPLLSHATF